MQVTNSVDGIKRGTVKVEFRVGSWHLEAALLHLVDTRGETDVEKIGRKAIMQALHLLLATGNEEFLVERVEDMAPHWAIAVRDSGRIQERIAALWPEFYS